MRRGAHDLRVGLRCPVESENLPARCIWQYIPVIDQLDSKRISREVAAISKPEMLASHKLKSLIATQGDRLIAVQQERINRACFERSWVYKGKALGCNTPERSINQSGVLLERPIGSGSSGHPVDNPKTATASTRGSRSNPRNLRSLRNGTYARTLLPTCSGTAVLAGREAVCLPRSK